MKVIALEHGQVPCGLLTMDKGIEVGGDCPRTTGRFGGGIISVRIGARLVDRARAAGPRLRTGLRHDRDREHRRRQGVRAHAVARS